MVNPCTLCDPTIFILVRMSDGFERKGVRGRRSVLQWCGRGEGALSRAGMGLVRILDCT